MAAPTTPVIGRYEIHALLGAGGWAEVWHGSVTLPTGLAQRCALKRLKGELATHPLYQHRLMRELEIGLAVTRDHPNLVTTQTCEVIAGRPSIVMELVVGSDLSSIDARLDFDMVRYLAAEVLSALEYLAAKGVVHRDLSPANILIDHQGAVRVGDFGLATWVEGDSWRDDVVGTEPYQAPEARAGGRFGCEADLYALGRILWELLTDDIDSPSLPRDTPKDLRDVVNGLLAPQPRERWTATRALARLARCDRARVAAQLGRMARGEVLTTTRARPRKGAPADVDDTRRSISAPDRDGASARYRAVARLGWLAAAAMMFILGSVVGANYLAPAQSQVPDVPVAAEKIDEIANNAARAASPQPDAEQHREHTPTDAPRDERRATLRDFKEAKNHSNARTQNDEVSLPQEQSIRRDIPATRASHDLRSSARNNPEPTHETWPTTIDNNVGPKEKNIGIETRIDDLIREGGRVFQTRHATVAISAGTRRKDSVLFRFAIEGPFTPSKGLAFMGGGAVLDVELELEEGSGHLVVHGIAQGTEHQITLRLTAENGVSVYLEELAIP